MLSFKLKGRETKPNSFETENLDEHPQKNYVTSTERGSELSKVVSVSVTRKSRTLFRSFINPFGVSRVL